MSKVFRFKKLLEDLENQPVSPEQLQYIRDLIEKKNIHIDDIMMDGFPSLENLTKGTASELIDYLLSRNECKNPDREYYGAESVIDLI